MLPQIVPAIVKGHPMNILLVSPEYPDTFWSFKHALRFVSKKVGQPPLGLLTVAALLPPKWNKRLVDLNHRKIDTRDLRWADYVFVGGMSVQSDSAREVIALCNELGTPVVAGGPLFTARHEEFEGVRHFVLNEAEITLPLFLEDLRLGQAKHLYRTDQWAHLETTPLPMWELIDRRQYATMNIQYSRGCPYDCEFCDITVLYGRLPRTKSCAQVLAEMDALYRYGWRSHVFFVDDNFIGNRVKLKNEVLPGMIRWMEERRYPFTLGTEASLNLSDDAELLEMMARAGFEEVFVGIESPNAESLEECKKIPNKNRDLIASVKILQRPASRCREASLSIWIMIRRPFLQPDTVHQGERHCSGDGGTPQRSDQLAPAQTAGKRGAPSRRRSRETIQTFP
jgi:radical SAM superfamily enzyme YgiQ (UPF0313 family)